MQALWGSWEQDAWVKDAATGQYLDPAKLRPVNLQGQYVASRGPLPIPPSEQGQPVVFSAGGPSPHMLELAGRYASGFIAEVLDHRGGACPARDGARGGPGGGARS